MEIVLKGVLIGPKYLNAGWIGTHLLPNAPKLV